MKESPVKIDALLEPLLLETSDQRADKILLQLIAVHAEPLIKGIIRYKLHLHESRPTQRDEAEDIYQEVLLQLLTQLQKFRRLPSRNPISDLRGLAAVIAHRSCSRWMRKQFPERHALRNRLHYLMKRQGGLALWQDEDGKQVAGFSSWQGNKRAAESTSRLSDLSLQPRLVWGYRRLSSSSIYAKPAWKRPKCEFPSLTPNPATPDRFDLRC